MAGDDDIDQHAIAFWQKEVHYYQQRAGGQGDAALRMVPLVAGAAALIPIVNSVLVKQPAGGPDLRWLLLVLPIAIVALWATAVRLLHEMEILRAYAAHAEFRLATLLGPIGTMAAYEPWEGLGSKQDKPTLVTGVWGASTLVISVAGVLVVPWMVAQEITGSWLLAAAVEVPFVAAIVVLALAFLRNDVDREKLLAELTAGGVAPE